MQTITDTNEANSIARYYGNNFGRPWTGFGMPWCGLFYRDLALPTALHAIVMQEAFAFADRAECTLAKAREWVSIGVKHDIDRMMLILDSKGQWL